MSSKLKRIEAGRYKTADGRFIVQNTFDPSGPPHVRCRGMNWLVEDTVRGIMQRAATLADARLMVAGKL